MAEGTVVDFQRRI